MLLGSFMVARWLIGGLLAAASLVLVPLPSLAADQDTTSIARVLELTNLERSKAGIPALSLNGELSNAAQMYSTVLAESDCFAHTCGPVPDFGDRLTQAGYTGMAAAGENIAAGYRTPEDVIQGWMNSPGHRANLLSSSYTEIGIGVATGGGKYGIFWTQDFGTRWGSPNPSRQSAAAPDQQDDTDQ
jgi:uncharacterized protein YkwD